MRTVCVHVRLCALHPWSAARARAACGSAASRMQPALGHARLTIALSSPSPTPPCLSRESSNALRQARAVGTHLVVGLIGDDDIVRNKGSPPVMPMEERYIALKSCKFVDEIIRYGRTW